MATLGKFKIINNKAIRERAVRLHDPRHVFYKAMLRCDTYEQYERSVGHVKVQPATTSYAVTGSMEMKYVRDRLHWIADA